METKNLFGVFTKGTSVDVMARIYAAMNLLQREGVEIPGTVANFFQSFSRLNDIYQTMTDEMARIDAMIDTLVLDENKLPQIGEGAPKIVTDFMAFLGSISSNPDKEFNYNKFATTANKFLRNDYDPIKDGNGRTYGGKVSLGFYCKEGAKSIETVKLLLKNNRAKFNATVLPFVEWLSKQEVPLEGMEFLRRGVEGADANRFGGTGLQDLNDALQVIKNESIPADSPEFQSAIGDFASGLSFLLDFFAKQLGLIMDPTPSTENKLAGLKGVKESSGKPIYMVCGEVVTSKLENFGALVNQFATFKRDFSGRLDTVAVSMRENIRFAGKFELRQTFARETLERANNALDVNLRLTTAKRRVLMRQMEAFAWPFEGAWKENHVKEEGDVVTKVKVTFPQDKWAPFIEALSVNLNALKTALGFAEHEKLPPAIASLAVTYLAQIDPRVGATVKSLDEPSYNSFLASFGQNPEADVLGAAIAALKAAPGDAQLLAAKQAAVEEFAEVDRKADKVEPSLQGILRLIKDVVTGNI